MQTFLIISFQGNIQSSKRFLFLCAFTYLDIAKFLKCAFKKTFQQAESASLVLDSHS
jgi:hypothetical protein